MGNGWQGILLRKRNLHRVIWTAFLLGFAGSLHCMGMCSPLVALVSRTRSMSKRIIYNLGRIVPYTILGGVAGAFGSLIHFSNLQFWFAIGFGIVMITLGFAGGSFSFPLITPLVAKMISKIKMWFSFYLAKKNSASIFFLGMLNGFIPCGLTYIAASYCILLPDAFNGILFMITFGLGTFPAMIGSPWVISKLAILFSLNAKRMMAIVVVVLGCSIIARAALVSYSSPKKENGTFSICK